MQCRSTIRTQKVQRKDHQHLNPKIKNSTSISHSN
uniref:Uncharacterized protein n=1 Tax=Rhizophora mucronata TaxID=61149 RepID=A0A2P2P8B7_RHIMU